MCRTYPLVFALIAIFILSACGQSNPPPLPTAAPTLEPTVTSIPTATPQTVSNETLEQARPGLIRIVNAIPDSPPLNVFAGFSAIATNLAYGQYTEQTSYNSGKVIFKVQLSGQSADTNPLLETEVTVPSGDAYIAVLTKRDDTIRLFWAEEKNDPLTPDVGVVHMINGLSSTTPVQLRSGDSELVPAIENENSATTAVLPAQLTPLTVISGSQSLEYPIEVARQTNITLIAVGTSDRISVIQFESAAPRRVMVRATNASPDLNRVDVYLDDQLLSAQVNYGRASERQPAAAGEYTVRVYAADADRNTVDPLAGGVIRLQDGENFNVMLLGSASALTVIAFAEDLTPIAANQARIAFINTLPNLAEIDVQTPTKPIRGIPTLFYGHSPSAVEVEPGSYTFLMSAVDGQNTRRTIETSENVQIESGYRYFFLVTGRQDGKPLILSDKLEYVAVGEDGQVTDTTVSTVRFINAVEDQTVDFSVNGNAVLTGLSYGQGSNFVAVTDRSATVTVSSSGQTTPLGTLETVLAPTRSYTIIAYRSSSRAVDMLVLDDQDLIFDGSSPHLRFINVSPNETDTLGLAVSEPNPSTASTTAPAVTEEPTQDPNQAPTIYTLPFGVEKLMDVLPGSASSTILMANGVSDIDLIVSEQNRLALTLPAIPFSGDTHLDVIAYIDARSQAVKAFTVTYPKRETPQA